MENVAEKRVPVCPQCGKRYILALVENMHIRCLKDAGGCGAEFRFTEVFNLYRSESEAS